MSEDWPKVKLGEVLRLIWSVVTMDDSNELYHDGRRLLFWTGVCSQRTKSIAEQFSIPRRTQFANWRFRDYAATCMCLGRCVRALSPKFDGELLRVHEFPFSSVMTER